MSDQPAQALDVYSNMRIPFAVAGWCREHKFHPLAANLAKLLRASAENQSELQRLEERDKALYDEMRSIIDKIESADAAEVVAKVATKKSPNLGVARRVKAA